MHRTHHCSELRLQHKGQSATLVGWVHKTRDHGGILFVDLRDREGLTQIVFNPDLKEVYHEASTIREESVIEVSGEVLERSKDTRNAKLPTGDIEMRVQSLKVHSLAEVLPFPIDAFKADKVGEELRLKYRYLDLRRKALADRIRQRAQMAREVRHYLESEGCMDIETPLLFKSTPEGAREFLVPSRLNPSEFYALSQSPQQYKQLLMVAGFERYYSLARCFRDEDLRADRQPEFTQIDVELSFVDSKAVQDLIEGLIRHVWKEVVGVALPKTFRRISYHQAMNDYGSDKPDTRFECLLQDFSDTFEDTDFKIFKQALSRGGVVKAICVKSLVDISEGELKHLEAEATRMGAKGLAYILARDEQPSAWRSPILKFFTPEQTATLKERLNIEKGDMVLFAATQWQEACEILGKVRLACAKLLEKRGKLDRLKTPWHFVWVVDFPLLVRDEQEDRYIAAHHPFTAPMQEDLDLLETEPLKVRSCAYDLVLNGVEIGGGSIRIHDKHLQSRVFKQVLGLPDETIEAHFGYLLKALGLGAPPHGGIALGFDRMCALLSGADSIREVIAFPKNQRGRDLQNGCPTPATEQQLKDLHIEAIEIETDEA